MNYTNLLLAILCYCKIIKCGLRLKLNLDRNILVLNENFCLVYDKEGHNVIYSSKTEQYYMQVPFILEKILNEIADRHFEFTLYDERRIISAVSSYLEHPCFKKLYYCYLYCPDFEKENFKKNAAEDKNCFCNDVDDFHKRHPLLEELYLDDFFKSMVKKKVNFKTANAYMGCDRLCYLHSCEAFANIMEHHNEKNNVSSENVENEPANKKKIHVNCKDFILSIDFLKIFPKKFIHNCSIHLLLTAYSLGNHTLRINYFDECHWYVAIDI